MKTLVGYTGFVGSNLVSQTNFSYLYNSKNIRDSYGTKPNLLVYSGVRAEKFLANKNPEQDHQIILGAIANIKLINPKKIILISTVDVYKHPINVSEDDEIVTKDLQPYGLHRYYLEKWVEENCKDHLIVRLPGLYGENIKKNFIYDLIHIIPSMINEDKFTELSKRDKAVENYYIKNTADGFYRCKELSDVEKTKLKDYFNNIGFSALHFSDSRGIFQYYNLSYLWKHLSIALKNRITKLNIATEPISISELAWHVNKLDFKNEITENPPHYDFKTKHFELFGGKNGYILDKIFLLEDIKQFIQKNQ